MMIWTMFAILTLVISISAYKLSVYADKIAEETGLGRNLVGLFILTAITSLPELITGISSVTVVQNPDIAVGDVLGSCVFNLMIIFLLDLLYRDGGSVYKRSTKGHIMTASLSMIMLSLVGFSFLVADFPLLQIGHWGITSLIIVLLYIFSLRESYQFEMTDQPKSNSNDRSSLKETYIYFSINAVIIVFAGSILPFMGDKIIEMMGWNAAFVGTIFIAFATSLPELAVTISAIRINAVELAFSNLLGSNLFNMIILAIDDFFYMKGPLLASVSSSHLTTLFSALMMTGLILVALIKPPEKKLLNSVSLVSILLLIIYGANVVFSF